MQLALTLVEQAGSCPVSIEIRELVIAGWAGRDLAAMEAHIRELEALGVTRPAATPTYYRIPASRLTLAERIECCGTDSSGEAEAVLFEHAGRMLVGLGSDHTDRTLEAHGVAWSKAVCDKPVASQCWLYSDVVDHWDSLILQSWIVEGGTRVLYQSGTLAGLRPADELVSLLTGGTRLPDGTAMFCGTLPAKGSIRPSAQFESTLTDPVLGREIQLVYTVEPLAIAG